MGCTATTEKLIKKLEELLKQAGGLRATSINRYYYLEVIAELEVLGERLVELTAQKEKLQRLLEVRYAEVFLRWREDVRVVARRRGREKNLP